MGPPDRIVAGQGLLVLVGPDEPVREGAGRDEDATGVGVRDALDASEQSLEEKDHRPPLGLADQSAVGERVRRLRVITGRGRGEGVRYGLVVPRIGLPMGVPDLEALRDSHRVGGCLAREGTVLHREVQEAGHDGECRDELLIQDIGVDICGPSGDEVLRVERMANAWEGRAESIPDAGANTLPGRPGSRCRYQ